MHLDRGQISPGLLQKRRCQCRQAVQNQQEVEAGESDQTSEVGKFKSLQLMMKFISTQRMAELSLYCNPE